jgi:hypothetical protein
MPIVSRIYPAVRLTVHEVTGDLSSEEFHETLRSFYKETGPTLNVLWDLRKTDWAAVSTPAVLAAVRGALHIYQEEVGTRRGGRTALVISDTAGLVAATMAQLLMDGYKPPPPFDVEVFSEMEEAGNWATGSPRKK